jgi:hypothetical protein
VGKPGIDQQMEQVAPHLVGRADVVLAAEQAAPAIFVALVDCDLRDDQQIR